MEEDECICSNKCINVHGENVNISYERPPLVEVEEVDECLCNVMCEGNHTVGIHERPLEKGMEEVDECICNIRCEGNHMIEENDSTICEQPPIENNFNRTSHCKPVPAQVPTVIYEQPPGIKYCSDIEPILPIYITIPYKASTSKKISYRFSFGAREAKYMGAMMEKTNPSMVMEQEGQEEVAWSGSREEDLPDHCSMVGTVPNTLTLSEKGWEEWEECVLPAAGGPRGQDIRAHQPGGGGGQDELAGGGGDQRDEALGGQGDDRLVQARRSGGGLAIDKDEQFQSMTVTEMISSWEEMEDGGDGGRMSLPIGTEEEGGRRSTRRNTRRSTGQGRGRGGR